MNVEKFTEFKVYRYRWLVLALYIGIATMIQILWANFFSITTEAAKYYGFANQAKGESAIGSLSVIFFVGMIIFSIPSMAAFERFGFKKSVGFGAAITGIAAMIRGIWGDSFPVVLLCTIVFAIAQPFILNAVNMISCRWFPKDEYATANGLAMLSNYIGVMLGLLLSPICLNHGMNIKQMLLLFGIATAIIALLFMIFAKEAPQSPPSAMSQYERLDFIKGFKVVFRKKDFVMICIAFLCALGVFNMFFTLIEPIISQLSNKTIDSTSTGVLGVIILGSAILGSMIIPILSDKDKYKRRKIYFVVGYSIGTLGFASFLFLHTFTEMCVAAFIYGFFCLGASPVLMTYCAEIAYPTSEGTSAGILLLLGNVSGALFLGADGLFKGNHLFSMLMMLALTLLGLVFMLASREIRVTPEDSNDNQDELLDSL